MTKAELYSKVSTEVAKVLEDTKVSKAVREELQKIIDEYLKPKSGGGKSAFPPIEIDGKKYYFCRYHSMYEPEEDMVLSNGKSKGYCKAAISKWNKQNANIKRMNEEIAKLVGEGKFEEAKKLSDEAEQLKGDILLPSYYNYIEDWATFNKVDTEEGLKELEEKYKTLKAIKA